MILTVKTPRDSCKIKPNLAPFLFTITNTIVLLILKVFWKLYLELITKSNQCYLVLVSCMKEVMKRGSFGREEITQDMNMPDSVLLSLL